MRREAAHSETPVPGGADVSTGRAARGGGSRAALPSGDDTRALERRKRRARVEGRARVERLRRVLCALAPVLERAGVILTDGRAASAWSLLSAGDPLAALVELSGGPVVESSAAAADALGSLLASGVLWAIEPEVWGVWDLAWVRACDRRPMREPVWWSFVCLANCGTFSDFEVEELRLSWGWRGSGK